MSEFSPERPQDASIFEGVERRYEPTPAGQRVIHLLVDTIIAYAITFLVFGAMAVVAPDAFATLTDESNAGAQLLLQLLALVVFVLTYILLEGGTKGRTLGKLLTGSVAVREDGSPITWKDATLRSLSRLVPFEQLSGFSNHPWHDKWTKTTVVLKRSLQKYA